jgi:NADH:ubiquinone oxidoreductase subunit 6 (subunit J)
VRTDAAETLLGTRFLIVILIVVFVVGVFLLIYFKKHR